MTYLNGNELRDKAARMDTTAELRELEEDIHAEMSKALAMLANEPDKDVRQAITDERYELRVLTKEVKNKMFAIVKAKRKRSK